MYWSHQLQALENWIFPSKLALPEKVSGSEVFLLFYAHHAFKGFAEFGDGHSTSVKFSSFFQISLSLRMDASSKPIDVFIFLRFFSP